MSMTTEELSKIQITLPKFDLHLLSKLRTSLLILSVSPANRIKQTSQHHKPIWAPLTYKLSFCNC